MCSQIRSATLAVLGASVLVLALAPPTVNADTIYVCWDGSGDYLTIQEGIDAASDGDEVVVCDGTYTGVGNKNLDFHGKAITVRSANGPENCIIDCENDGRGFYFHSGETDASVADGFTITNGFTRGDPYGYSGGGVLVASGNPTIAGCVITCNEALGGGAIACWSMVTISNCVIRRNIADSGGGVHANGGSVRLLNCMILENAGENGGGIRCSGGSATMSDCVIAANTAEFGGGIDSDGGELMISNCVITDNRAGYGGGAACQYNTAATVTNSTIMGNGADGGAGIYCASGDVALTNCTFTGNTAEDRGGAILSRPYNDTIITNCVLWSDSAPQGPEIALENPYGDPPTLTISYSDIEGEEAAVYLEGGSILNWGEGNIDADPVFAFTDDHHLMPASPCIDAGTNDPPGGLPPADFDGNPRPLDGDGDSNPVADMGVYEFNPALASIAVSPCTLEFFVVEGGLKADDQILSIRNCGGAMLNWEIVEECSWLTADPSSGDSTGEVDEVVLSVNVDGLSHGDYACVLTVSDLDAANSPRQLQVTLHVNATLHVPAEYAMIQAAIDAAVDGDVVLIADGTYTGTGNRDLDFRGKAITVRSENGPENCIIDCEGSESDPHRGFCFRSGETAASVLDGLMITNGYQSGAAIHCTRASGPTITGCVITENTSAGSGGGICCGGFAQPTIVNCTITENTADGGGGGIYLASGWGADAVITDCVISGNTSLDWDGGGIYVGSELSSTISGCTISGNTAGRRGGGIYCGEDSNLVITHCTISGNSAMSDDGGGIYYEWRSNSVITHCVLEGNWARWNGDAIYGDGSDLTITHCMIAQNPGRALSLSHECAAIVTDCTIADNTGGGVGVGGSSNALFVRCTIVGNGTIYGGCHHGGGLSLGSCSATFVDCIIADNAAGWGGGGVYHFGGGPPTLVNCEITRNAVLKYGGGVFCGGFGLRLINCMITENAANRYGGGLYCRYEGSPRLINCTISGNSATVIGGGVYCTDLGAPEFTNSILWDDTPQEIYVYSGSPVLTYCDVEGGWPGEGNIDADPLFVDPDNGDYRLSAGSPCIDAADNEAVPADGLDLDGDGDTDEPIPFDLDGDPRFIDDPDTEDTGNPDPDYPELPIVDMGAYEFQIPGDLNGDGCVDQVDLGILLADWDCTGGGCPGDCDHDGDTDQADLGILLAHWGQGCP